MYRSIDTDAQATQQGQVEVPYRNVSHRRAGCDELNMVSKRC